MPTHTFPLDGPINLQVRMTHGQVIVETQDGLTEATVTIEAGKHATDLLDQTTVEMRGRTLTVVAPRQGGIFDLPMFGSRRTGRGLDVRIVIPTGTAVKISTFTAPIRILGRVGGADLAFGSGEAAAREIDGDLRLRFGSGQASAVHVRGSVHVRSGSGNVRFGEIDGELESGLGSGDLDVRVMRGALRWRSGSGSARLGAVHGDVDIATGSGTFEIGLPAGTSAQVDVHTGSGQLQSELPVETQAASSNNSIRVRARTGSGDVRLFRAA